MKGTVVAKIIPSVNGVVLDQVSVAFDPITETVKIFCNDEELPVGFVLGVQRNGRVEKDLVNLLQKHGRLPHMEEMIEEDEYYNYSEELETGGEKEPASTLPVASDDEKNNVDSGFDQNVAKEDNTTVLVNNSVEIYEVENPSQFVIDPIGTVPTINFENKGNLITLVSAQERTGKTTGAVMLASAFARTPEIHSLRGKEKVVVLDLDLNNATVSELTNARTGGMLGVYDTGKITEETVLNNLVYNAQLGIHVLPVGNIFENPENYIGEEFIRETIKILRTLFNIVIVDTPTQDITRSVPFLVDQSDILILGSVFERGTNYAIRDWLKSHIRYQKTVAKLTVLMFTTPKLRVTAALNEVKNTFKPLSIVGNVPTDTAGFLASVKNNMLVNTFTTHNMVADAYMVIAERFLAKNI